MAFEEKYLDVLQNIEFPIQSVYKARPELTDYDVLSAIEALIDFYTAEERKREPKDFRLSEISIEVYNDVKEMCDFRLGKGNSKNVSVEGSPKPLLISELLSCLKTIKNSINKWTKRYGRQGYLNFVKQYMLYV